MGLPAVISDLGGAREMFPDGTSGKVYCRGSIDELAKILAVKVSAGHLTDDMRDTVRQDILRRFGAGSMTKAWFATLWPITDPEVMRQ